MAPLKTSVCLHAQSSDLKFLNPVGNRLAKLLGSQLKVVELADRASHADAVLALRQAVEGFVVIFAHGSGDYLRGGEYRSRASGENIEIEKFLTRDDLNAFSGIPIAAPLLDYLKMHIPTEPDGPFFPGAYATKQEANGESRLLSAEFHRLLVEAGLAKPRPKDKNSGRGHSVKRTVSELSFHSLRHNTTSWLKRAGVPESVVRDIIGHESELVSREYTHMDDEAKRKAILKLPVLK